MEWTLEYGTIRWTTCCGFLRTAGKGEYIEDNGRRAEVACMCGGRYALYDADGVFEDVTDDENAVLAYLVTGWLCRKK